MESTTYYSESEYLSKEAIDELRTTEERYRLAHEATKEGIWDWNLITNIVFVNERWSDITGYTKGDPAIPDPIEYWYSRIHPDDKDRILAKREGLLKENTEGFEEYRFFHNSGKRRWLRSSIKMKYNEEGKPVRMIGSLKDITDRKEAEEALLESENKFRKLLKYSPVLFYKRSYVSDKYEYVSPVVYDILGFGPDEFTHFSFDEVLEYVHPEDLFSLSKAFQEAIDVNNGQFQSEYRMKCKNGEYIWVFDMAHISTDSYNKPVSITGSIINITSRKMVEAAIKQSEEELNYAQEISKMGSWELNFLTGELVFSRNQFKILGLPENKVKISYNDFLGFVHPDDLHLLEEKLEEIKRNRTVQCFEFRLLLPDGTIKWLEYYVVPVFKEDTLIALKGVNIDISGKKQIQDELRNSERKYQNLVEIISDAVYEFDSKGVITYITPMIEKISG